MSTPDPESFSLLAKVMGAAAVILTPVYGASKWLDGRFEKKADKAEVDRHRDYFIKVFEKLEDHQKSDNEHFDRITNLMHSQHAEILKELGRKEDR
jgi:hypothetical protein